VTLPTFRYHPDPVRSGSIVESDQACSSCGESRGYIYDDQPYGEQEEDLTICPWCIADGSAHKKFDVEFMDEAVFEDDIPEAAIEEIVQRTPGYASWQGEAWPTCCGDATAFIMPAGIEEIRTPENYELEGMIFDHVVHGMGMSGSSVTRLVNSLNRDKGPTVYVFRCLHCKGPKFHIDFL
jgi:uncharacterized protein